MNSASTPSSLASPPPFAPKARIARLKVRWLQNGAKSKNGRIYPPETVQRLVQSGQDAIRNGDAQQLTCFSSHAAADNDDVFQLTGMPREIWQEGEDAFAWLDIADTSAGRDMVSLAKGGYLRKMSLRARNAMLEMQPGYDMPVVTGDNIQLEGMDFTTRAGIEVADIQGVLTENVSIAYMTDTFDVDLSQMVLETFPSDGASLVESITTTFTHGSTASTSKPAEGTNPLLFPVQISKTPEQKLQEAFDAKLEAKLAEQRKAFEAMLARVAPTTPATQTPEPQRQTLSEAAMAQHGTGTLAESGSNSAIPTQIYTHGSYMREHLHPSKWAALADRTRPLPEGLNPEYALKEMSEILAGAIVAGIIIGNG
jgi:hypothetical protein